MVSLRGGHDQTQAERDGFEPSHALRRDLCLANRHYNQLSQRSKGDPDEVRTRDLSLDRAACSPLHHRVESVIERS